MENSETIFVCHRRYFVLDFVRLCFQFRITEALFIYLFKRFTNIDRIYKTFEIR